MMRVAHLCAIVWLSGCHSSCAGSWTHEVILPAGNYTVVPDAEITWWDARAEDCEREIQAREYSRNFDGAHAVAMTSILVTAFGAYLNTESGWIRYDSVFSEAERRDILALARSGGSAQTMCTGVVVEPFRGARQFAAVTRQYVGIVDLDTHTRRILDQTGAMLESCHMDETGFRYVCTLDMPFATVTAFDKTGGELHGNFVPFWAR